MGQQRMTFRFHHARECQRAEIWWCQAPQELPGQLRKGEQLVDLSVSLDQGEVTVFRTILKYDIDVKASLSILFLDMIFFPVFAQSVGPWVLTWTKSKRLGLPSHLVWFL